MTVAPRDTSKGGGGTGSVPLSPYGGGSISIPIIGSAPVPNIIIPPGGFIGFGQQTAATQALFQRAGRIGGMRSAAKRRKRKKTASGKVSRRAPQRRRRSSARPARLVKGSAAAKRYMARIRRKRKK